MTDLEPLDYAEVLGPSGPSGWAERYLMGRLVKAGGDVDALVALYAQDLAPSGATHLRIAEELESAGRAGEGLAWAGAADLGTAPPRRTSMAV